MDLLTDVLSQIVGRLKRSGDGWSMASCPLHRDRTPSFAVNMRNGCWVCHSCGEKGTLPRLLRLLGYPRARIDSIMGPLRPQLESRMRREKFALSHRFQSDPYRAEPVLPEYLLGAYDYCPICLLEQGFSARLLQSLDIGFDNNLGRITFPIRDLYGNLAGISGRSVSGRGPRYKVYSGGFRCQAGWIPGDFGENFDEEFPNYRLDKGRYLWHGDEALPLAAEASAKEPVVIVEGFKAALWLIQYGFPLTVALMGSSISHYQADLLRRLANPLVLFLDNNYAGQHGTRKAVDALAQSNLVHSVDYPGDADEHTQPDDLQPEVVGHMVSTAKREYGTHWRKRKRTYSMNSNRKGART